MTNLNLINDSFIKVIGLNGEEREVSFREALIDAHQIRRIYGDCIAQDMAIERILRAFLYPVIEHFDSEGNAEQLEDPDQAFERWINIWNQGYFPSEPLLNYLTETENSFNLIDPVHPAFQVHETEKIIEFRASSGKIARGDGINYRSVNKLVGTVFASKTRPRVWSDRYFSEESVLTLPDAARWLIFINVFDDASFKKPPTDIHSAFCGQMTGIYAEGKNLFETLMLNLPLFTKDEKMLTGNVPYWDMKPLGRSQVVVAPPDNPAYLLSFPFRRMNLKINDNGLISGYELTGHHSFDTEKYQIESNGVYRKPNQEKGIELGFKKLSTDWLWKNYSDLFLDADDNTRPGIIDWIDYVISNSDLEIPNLVFRSITVNYKNRQCVIADMTEDSLILNSSLLNESSIEWRKEIAVTVSNLNKCAQQTGYFYRNLFIAEGGDLNKDQQSKAGETEFWNRIDLPFRNWLSEISSISDFLEKEFLIRQEVYIVVDSIIQDKKRTSNLKTAIGRTVKIGKGGKAVEREFNLQSACGIYKNSVMNIMGEKKNGK